MNKSQKFLVPLYRANQSKQHGVVLIMALTILMVLTLVGVSAMKTSSLQERMSGNSRDYQIAFEAAEIALRAGEDYVKGIATTADFTGNNGKFQPRDINATTTAAWQDETNWTSSNTTSVTLPSGYASKNPEYMIELLDSKYGKQNCIESGCATVAAITIFRITARGYGKNPNTKVMLQSDYGAFVN